MATERRTRPGATARNLAGVKPTDLSALNDRGASLADRMKTAKFPGFISPDATPAKRQRYEDELAAYNASLVDKHTGLFTVAVNNGRGGIDKDSRRVLDFRDVIAGGEFPEREDIIDEYRSEYGRLKVGKSQTPVSAIADTRIVVMRGRPDIDFTDRGERRGELVQPNDRYTTQQMIVNFVKDVKTFKKKQSLSKTLLRW